MRLTDVDNFMLGNKQVDKIYLDNVVVWSSMPMTLPAPNNFGMTVRYHSTAPTFTLDFSWDKVISADSYVITYTLDGGPDKTVTVQSGTTTTISSDSEMRGTNIITVAAYVKAVRNGTYSAASYTVSKEVRKKAIKPGAPTLVSISGACETCTEGGCDCSSSDKFVDYVVATVNVGNGGDIVKLTGGGRYSTGSSTTTLTLRPHCIAIYQASFKAYSYNDGTPSEVLSFSHQQKCIIVKPTT